MYVYLCLLPLYLAKLGGIYMEKHFIGASNLNILC